MINTPELSRAKQFVRSACHVKQLGSDVFADFQMAMAILSRCGIAAFINPSPTPGQPQITGPLAASQTVQGIDPLYMQFKATITWESGATATQTIDYAAEYCDMTTIWNYSWGGAPATQTNIAAAFPVFPLIDTSLHPSPPPQNTYAIDATHQPFNLSTSTTTKLIYEWPGWDEYDNAMPPNFIQHHYGGSIKFELNNPASFSDFAAICNTLLNQITLRDSTKNYPDDPVHPTVNYHLIYMSDFPVNPSDAQLLPLTNVLAVRKTRLGYYFSVRAFLLSSEGRNLITWNYKGNPTQTCASYIFSNTGLPRTLVKLPLAANGLCTAPIGASTGILVYNVATLDSAATILSVKSSVKNLVAMTATARKQIFNPATNAFGGAAGTVPAGLGENNFLPGDVGGLGYLAAVYTVAFNITASLVPDDYETHFGLVSVPAARGQSIIFYATTSDLCLSYLDNIPAVWSLTSKTGFAQDSDLVVAADGKSAVYTASPNGPSFALIHVTATGLNTHDQYGVTAN